jgi:hypothetical protein
MEDSKLTPCVIYIRGPLHIQDVVVWNFNKETKDERRGEWVICGYSGNWGKQDSPHNHPSNSISSFDHPTKHSWS